ncbi:hypothetical protein ACLB2K_055695 [Fragaria x ananassa]
MAANEVPLLNLFDSFWFEHAVFSSKPHAAADNNPSLQPDQEDQIRIKEPNPAGLPTLVVRSLSDQYLDTKSSFFSDSSLSPHSVLPTRSRKLQTIPSGKEVLIDFSRESTVPVKQALEVGSAPLKKKVLHNERSKTRKRSGSSKSLSDLEFDELKGFMDLGFVFTEEDNKDSNLVAIIPGLQRLRVSDEGEEQDRDHEEKRIDASHHHHHSQVVSRPYLSEAWDALEYQRKENQLMNWRVPSALDKDMKHHLKFWAHTVASTIVMFF